MMLNMSERFVALKKVWKHFFPVKCGKSKRFGAPHDDSRDQKTLLPVVHFLRFTAALLTFLVYLIRLIFSGLLLRFDLKHFSME